MDKQRSIEDIVAEAKARQAQETQAKQEALDAAVAEFNATTGAEAAQRERAKQEALDAAERDRQARAQADFDARHKVPALRAWLASGGTAADFEAQWPAEAQRIRMAEAVRQTQDVRQHMAATIYREL